VTITDDALLVEGSPAPGCLIVPESWALLVSNNAEGDATVSWADSTFELFTGDEHLIGPIGEAFWPGESFELTVAELDAVVRIDVVAATTD
jgi:hypothetical protein